ncbi:cobalt ECF transporter T component CbiQ [uncultured Thiodictyon sp.]|uniref:cobalt ECF transporter T component CbiQ n=1 Tax=uncultured Thiodictyon sp. TaxID=1846217 RepID=UPI0025E9A2D5|nr:cobalt ECF transporter T component CbiQ [uncultured Thiodictyon sp.]
MFPIDQYAWTHRWRGHHPAERAVLAGGMLLIAITAPPLATAPLVVLAMAGATVAGAGVPLAAWLRVMTIPAGFLLLSLPFLAVSLDLTDGVALTVSAAGAWLAVAVGLRSLAAVSALAFLTLTTPVAELVPWLRRVGVPQAVVEIALLIYRLLFILADCADATRHAQEARLGYSTTRRGIRSLGLLAGTLLTRALARTRRLEIGLAARGFEGELRVLASERTLSRPRLAAVAALLFTVAALGLTLDRALH